MASATGSDGIRSGEAFAFTGILYLPLDFLCLESPPRLKFVYAPPVQPSGGLLANTVTIFLFRHAIRVKGGDSEESVNPYPCVNP
jgi:hypothetical protein